MGVARTRLRRKSTDAASNRAWTKAKGGNSSSGNQAAADASPPARGGTSDWHDAA
jgi:hypothetical protein